MSEQTPKAPEPSAMAAQQIAELQVQLHHGNQKAQVQEETINQILKANIENETNRRLLESTNNGLLLKVSEQAVQLEKLKNTDESAKEVIRLNGEVERLNRVVAALDGEVHRLQDEAKKPEAPQDSDEDAA